MSNGDHFRELIEAYALGALDAEDRAALDAHLVAGCADCAKALEEARWLVSQLAYAAPDAAPSDMLKGRLMQQVRAEGKHTETQSKPHMLTAKNVIPAWLWAAVAALLVFSVYSTWNMRRLQEDIRKTNDRAAELVAEREKAEQQLAIAKREAMILMDPSSHKIALWGEHAHPETLEAKWHAQLGLCVMGDKVPMPSANRVLQVWFIPKSKDAKPMPSKMVRPDTDGKLVLLIAAPPESMENTKAIAITEEPAGGSPWPTSAPIWSGNVS
ncbi:MAG TPA: anti-sigma factor [Candidatus Methylomirabilis sp.]|nr:anti-sigma factor [Candidatus Methylomirabilis sp.]